MASTSAITGKFLDVAGKPLTGKITATSTRDYILIPGTNVEIYAGNITRSLGSQGEITLNLIPGEYTLEFDLSTESGQEIPIKPVTTVVERSTAIGTLLGATEPEPADEHDDVADEPGEVTEIPEN